ncbi:MAG: DUF115 domain-containing protein [Promethearchaeota archaeon]|nr:MAG: DUF115 domain-containing protein [Candidatus Lokiarchaeota archaeon]
MKWDQWKSWYLQIISDFGYDPQQDLESAILLNKMLTQTRTEVDISKLYELVNRRIVFVYGCGPSLPIHLNSLKKPQIMLENYVHIAADGATTALLRYEVIPDIILTDLDGRIPDLINANEKGAITLIHAHGDNKDLIIKYFPLFPGLVLGSTQNQPVGLVKNYGGFTDGDRCVFLAEEMGADLTILVGFDFGQIVGKFSKPYFTNDVMANESKVKKLGWAQKLITELSKTGKLRILKLNNQTVQLGKVENVTADDLIKILK